MNSLPGAEGNGVPVWSCNVHIGCRGQVKGDLGLQRVRVLELVNENVGVSFLEMATGSRGRHVAGSRAHIRRSSKVATPSALR